MSDPARPHPTGARSENAQLASASTSAVGRLLEALLDGTLTAERAAGGIVNAQRLGRALQAEDVELVDAWLASAASMAAACCQVHDPHLKALGARLDELVATAQQDLSRRLALCRGVDRPEALPEM